ncbi:MAG: hypothetical protein QOF51_3126 [Chloroflexota bacterium]|jgi:hypothetical protein|nr:hypothetical protein [Chloroflexota bacterium]
MERTAPQSTSDASEEAHLWRPRGAQLAPPAPASPGLDGELARLVTEIGIADLRRLRVLLPPVAMPRAELVAPTEYRVLALLARRGLIELVGAETAADEHLPVRLTDRGRELASAIKPTVHDYTVQRGGGGPLHACESCGAVPSTRAVRVCRAALSNPLVEAHYFCDRHATDADASYRALRALYTGGILNG